jgi:carboxypeptidase Taq
MAAAQLMRRRVRAEPAWMRNWRRATWAPLLSLAARACAGAKGSLLGFQDLLRAATGKPLDPRDFTAHLTARYLA